MANQQLPGHRISTNQPARLNLGTIPNRFHVGDHHLSAPKTGHTPTEQSATTTPSDIATTQFTNHHNNNPKRRTVRVVRVPRVLSGMPSSETIFRVKAGLGGSDIRNVSCKRSIHFGSPRTGVSRVSAMGRQTPVALARRGVAMGWVAAVSMVVGAACAGTTTPPPTVDALHIRLSDFSVGLDTHHVAAGPTRIDVSNAGPTEHEIVIVRTPLKPAQMALNSSGIRLEEDQLQKILDIGGVDMGARATRTIDLAPGHYVAFCNLPGHFLGLMYSEFVVSKPGAVS